MSATYESVLGAIVERDERHIVLTAENRAAIRGLPGRLGERFVDTGITEQTMIGMAAGLALRGRIPVAHALSSFLTMRAFEFIRTDIGIAGLPVKLVGYIPGVLSDGNGPTHQALEDMALMRGIPGMHVFCPADLDDLLIGLPHLLGDPSPWYIRYTDRAAVTQHDPQFAPGKAETLRHGNQVCIVVAGVLLREVLDAAQLLDRAGVSATVINVRTLKPLDDATVLAAITRSPLTITVEDHFLTGGLYSTIAQLLLRQQRTARVIPISFDGRWFTPALLPDVLRHEELLGPHLAERILLALRQTH